MKKSLILFVTAMLAMPALAQTATVTDNEDRGFQLKRGTYNVGPPRATKAECRAGITADVLSRRASARYTCNGTTAYTGTFSATAPVVCRAPRAPVVETPSGLSCPAGTTGTVTQRVTFSMGPAPQCIETGTTEPPVYSCAPVVPPPAGTGSTIYLSDCQTGAASSCTPGDNANPGTQASPKRDIGGITTTCTTPGASGINCLPAGSTVLFARGGAWPALNLWLDNRLATKAAPIVFDAYGAGPAPIIRSVSIGGTYGNTVQDGGYTVRNLKIDGQNTQDACVFASSALKGVLFESNEITRCRLGFNIQNMGPGTDGFIVRRNRIHHNTGMGFLGDAFGLVIEDNLIEYNNIGGNWGDHGIYIAGHGTDGIIRRNKLQFNSVGADGVCRGGNLTVHGRWDGMLIQGNTIIQERAVGGCYGMSITPGYDSAEFFRRFIVEDNTVVNVGGCAYCAGAAVNPVFRRNKVVMTGGNWITGFLARTNVGLPGAGGDDVDSGMTVEDNLVCFYSANPPEEQTPVNLGGTPGSSQARNTVLVGPAATADPRCAIP